MPKKNKKGKITLDGEWKRISLDVPFTLEETGESFPLEDLIEIEELTDYHIDADGNIEAAQPEDSVDEFPARPSKRAERKKKRRADGDDSKQPAKRNKQEREDAAVQSEEDTIESSESPQRVSAKAEKKNKKPPKRKLPKIVDATGGTESDGNDVAARPTLKQKKKSKKAGKKTAMVTGNDKPEESELSDEAAEDLRSADQASQIDNAEWMEWEQLPVADYVLKALKEMKFSKPTPVQEQCLPAAISSRKDIIGAAETGSGKTLAFAIPIVQNIVEDKKNELEKEVDSKYLRALVITPTRELAVQIKKHIQAISVHTDVTTCLIVGGMFKEKQDRLLKRCPDIVIATPGRLYDHIQQNTPHLSELNRLRYLVLDEADRMVEHGHFQELTKIMEKLNEDARSAAKRQNFIFSATLCMDTAKTEKKKWKKSEDDRSKVGNLSELMSVKQNAKVVNLSEPEGTAGALTELRLPCTTKDKDYYFYYLLMAEATGRTIIFCNSLDCVRRLYGVFSYLLSETHRTPLVLHAGMHQKQRLKNLERFHANPKGVLLASDVASRGLDIPDVQYVIHYQVPRNPDLYVHRSGRTARAFKVGTSVVLVDPSDAPAYNKILRSLNREKDFALVDVDVKLLRFAKERVDLARKIDSVEHQLRKESSKDEWFLKAAEESGLIIDEDDVRNLDIQGGSQRSAKSKESKFLKRQLKFMLSQPIKSNMPGFSRKYPSLNFAQKQLSSS